MPTIAKPLRKSYDFQVTWFTVALTTTACLCSIMITFMFKRWALSEVQFLAKHAPPQGSAERRSGHHRSTRGERHGPEIYCSFNIYEAARQSFDISDVPHKYCDHVIICCVTNNKFDIDWHIVNALNMLRGIREASQTFIEFEVGGDESGWFTDGIRNTNASAGLSRRMAKLVMKHNLTGGLFIHIPNYEAIPSNRDIGVFLRFLGSAMMAIDKTVLVSLPREPRDLKIFLSKQITVRHPVYYVIHSHFVPPYNMSGHTTSCSSPWKYPHSQRTVHGMLTTIKKFTGKNLETHSNHFLTGFDVTAYSYFAQDRFPYNLNGRAPIPHREFCGTCSSGVATVGFWRNYRDLYTDCHVSVADNTVRTSANPMVAKRITDFFGGRLHGFVIFNVHLDDFTGVCGVRYNFVRNLYCVIKGIGINECQELNFY